jgi:hypothetical protein
MVHGRQDPYLFQLGGYLHIGRAVVTYYGSASGERESLAKTAFQFILKKKNDLLLTKYFCHVLMNFVISNFVQPIEQLNRRKI